MNLVSKTEVVENGVTYILETYDNGYIKKYIKNVVDVDEDNLPTVSVELDKDTCIAGQEPIHAVGKILDPQGNIIPITDTFRVPISDVDGKIVKIVLIKVVNGEINFDLTFDKSGYYFVTEKNLNYKFPYKMFKLKEDIEFIVYEV